MLHKIDTTKDFDYKFILNSDWTKNIVSYDQIFKNDIYTKYNSTLNDVEGELIICNDINKTDIFCQKVVSETYQEYLELIAQRNFIKEQWSYNIIDGVAEQDKILFRDEQIIIIPCYTWTRQDENLSQMHILVFPLDKSLHSIRDLTETHINLLKHIKKTTLEVIKNKYNFDEDILKMFLHYSPSTYHLHIHFTLITNTQSNSSVEYSHDLTNVINILSVKSDFYQTIIMNKRI